MFLVQCIGSIYALDIVSCLCQFRIPMPLINISEAEKSVKAILVDIESQLQNDRLMRIKWSMTKNEQAAVVDKIKDVNSSNNICCFIKFFHSFQYCTVVIANETKSLQLATKLNDHVDYFINNASNDTKLPETVQEMTETDIFGSKLNKRSMSQIGKLFKIASNFQFNSVKGCIFASICRINCIRTKQKPKHAIFSVNAHLQRRINLYLCPLNNNQNANKRRILRRRTENFIDSDDSDDDPDFFSHGITPQGSVSLDSDNENDKIPKIPSKHSNLTQKYDGYNLSLSNHDLNQELDISMQCDNVEFDQPSFSFQFSFSSAQTLSNCYFDCDEIEFSDEETTQKGDSKSDNHTQDESKVEISSSDDSNECIKESRRICETITRKTTTRLC